MAQNDIMKRLRSDVSGQGKVTVHQDPRIEALLGTNHPVTSEEGVAGERRVIRKPGYRLQVYAGNNTRQAKNEAHNAASRIREHFPELPVYTTFNPPRWLCRAGDFRSIEEADAMMRQLRASGVFKEVSIVKDHINIHL